MWEVREDDGVRSYSSRMVERMLSSGELSGAEFARVDEGEWAQLYQLPIFRKAVPVAGDPRKMVAWRMFKPLAIHLMVYLVVIGVFIPPGAKFFVAGGWGIGVLAQAASVIPGMLALLGGSAEAPVAPAEAEVAPESAFAETSRSMAAELSDNPELAAEVGQLDALGRSLAKRIATLDRLVDEEELLRLEKEVGRIDAQLELEDDPRDREALQREQESITERVAVMKDAASALERLQTEERALVHQMEGLRLALARAAVASEDVPDLLQDVRTMREKAEAEAQLDDELARARQAASKAARKV